MSSSTSIRRAVLGLGSVLFAFALSVAGCGDDPQNQGGCDPTKGDSCACDIANAASCPGGYICRPSEGKNVCEPMETAGRIPSCMDPKGLDVYAAEADGALSVSWKVNGAFDVAGGFEVRYGTATGVYDQTPLKVGADARRATIRPLDNEKSHYVVVAPLGANGMSSFVSCQVAGIPHELRFGLDLLPTPATGSDEGDPDLAANIDGSRLYLAWEDGAGVGLTISKDLGDTWTAAAPLTASGANPAIVVHNAVLDKDGKVLKPEALHLTWEEGGKILFATFDPATGSYSAPVTVGSGTNPDIALGLDRVHVAFVENNTIKHASSLDNAAFDAPVAVSGQLTNTKAPSVTVHPTSGDVIVAWDALEGSGDSNVYSATSKDAGATFAMPVRIDDDKQGQNQTNVSITADPQTGELFATWEDRRGGANVFFSTSKDGGATWAANIDVGAGLGGDQFHPQAVVDVAGNVYVAFFDTTNGQRVVFSRFNENGTFDPPLAPSTNAGSGGVVGDFPTVATDVFGTVYVAWEENRDGPDLDVVFARAD